MSLETVARQSLYRQTRARGGELRSLADRRLLSRIWRFAQRHHRKLAVFLAVSVVSALLTVATPLLAGRVVDEITGPGVTSVVVMKNRRVPSCRPRTYSLRYALLIAFFTCTRVKS